MPRNLAAIVLAAASILVAPVIGAAQTPPPYRPGLGDLMTMTVQPRHIKLALAGQAKNWPYAAYELHELEESFERAARAWPKWRSTPIDEMMKSVTTEPMAALAQAIKDADAAQFTAPYAKLTDGCNACHQAANQAMIVITLPDASAYHDPHFRAVKP